MRTCNLLDRFREPPARAHSSESDGDGRVVGRLRIDRVELWGANSSSYESFRVDDAENDGNFYDEI